MLVEEQARHDRDERGGGQNRHQHEGDTDPDEEAVAVRLDDCAEYDAAAWPRRVQRST